MSKHCPIFWCTFCDDESEKWDEGDPLLGEHYVYVLRPSTGFGQLSVYVRVTKDAAGVYAMTPAAVHVDLAANDFMGVKPLDSVVLARAFDLATAIAEAINGGEWGTLPEFMAENELLLRSRNSDVAGAGV